MKRQGMPERMVRVLTLGAAVLGIILPLEALAASPRPVFPWGFVQTNEDGFGDCQNSYSWSMAWFKGKLYVGTNRQSVVQFMRDPDFNCEGDDGAAEIWQYAPETNAWELVFKSPSDVPIPPGEFKARDNGFRDMVVFREADGTEALYVGGVVYAYFPGDPRRPRILRSTDGLTFEPIPQDPGTFLGDIGADSFRAMAAYKERLFVTAGSAFGEGIILEAEYPAGGNNHFRQVSPPGLLAFELEVFDGFLYVGSFDFRAGFSVLKTDASPTSTPYYDFIPVVTEGAYTEYPLVNSAVLSMEVFKDRLYVGSQTDLIRINPDDTWDLVVGNRRHTPEGGELFPISGLPGGFGNPFTGHLWRMERHGTWFYVGTWDFSVFLRNLPIIGWIAAYEAGFDLWKTEDGVFWFQITRDGFGNKFNHGVRSLESTPLGLFLGTANPWDGTQVWLGGYDGSASDLGSSAERGQTSLTQPDRLEAESQGGVVVLSWTTSPGAVRFEVFRAGYWPNRVVGIPELPVDAWIPGPFTSIGTTVQPFFEDSIPVNEGRYAYYVQAEGRRRQVSDPSNVAIVPSLAPVVTFDRVDVTILDLAGRGRVKALGGEAALLRFLLAMGRVAAVRGDLPRARRWLNVLHDRVVQNGRGVLEPLAAEELEIIVAKLVRRVSLAQAGVIPARSVVEGHAASISDGE